MVGAGRDGRWRSGSVLAVVTVVALVAGLFGAVPAAASHDVDTARVAGVDRYATAARLADAWDPAGVDVVFLARGDAFPDGLAAAPLAGQTGVPLLLVAPDRVPEATRDALARLDPRRVVLLGGTAAIDDTVAALLAADHTVERIAGVDRYATAAQITRRIAAEGNIGTVDGRRSVFVASGATFPDALAAGAAAATMTPPLPVLLTRPDHLPTATSDAFTELAVEQAFVVGGDAAVTPTVTDALTDLGVHVERLAGANRQATAARIADVTIAHSDATGARVLLARGDAFPDALAAGPTAARLDAPLVLTHDPGHLGATTTEWFDSACLLIGNITAVGGTAAITHGTLDHAAATVGGCHGTWGNIPDAPIGPRMNHSATWTGDRMIIWGGSDGTSVFNDGVAWDPTEREWRRIPPAPIVARWSHEAFWLGEELLVWGGTQGPTHLADCYTDGARYDPVTGTWQTVPTAPSVIGCQPSTVWTGEEMIAYGGYGAVMPTSENLIGDAVGYDPTGGTWRTLPDPPLSPRFGAVAVWTGTEMLVVGGSDGEYRPLPDGAAYNPSTNAWRTVPNVPDAVTSAVLGAWTGDELVVIGNPTDQSTLQHAAAYDPSTDRWRALPDLPTPQSFGTLTAGGEGLYLLGQSDHDGPPPAPPPPAFAYDAAAERWTRLPDPPTALGSPTLVWTGAELVVWGRPSGETEGSTGLTWRP